MSDSTVTLPNSPPPNSPQTASQLTLFAEGSLARTSPSQGEGQEWAKAHAADYGASTPVLLANYDHATSSWKTSQHFLGEGLTVFSETWPRSGTMQSGTAYRLPPLVRLTDETGFGLWLTPRASDTGKGENNKTFLVRMNDRTDKCAQSLPTQVNNPKTWPKQTLWRTPCAGDAGRGVCASKETMDAKLEKGGATKFEQSSEASTPLAHAAGGRPQRGHQSSGSGEGKTTRVLAKSTRDGYGSERGHVAHAHIAGLQIINEIRDSRQTASRIIEGGELERAYSESGAKQWRVEPDVGRVANGVSSRVDRLKSLGNAVVPQIPELIGRAILSAEAASPQEE